MDLLSTLDTVSVIANGKFHIVSMENRTLPIPIFNETEFVNAAYKNLLFDQNSTVSNSSAPGASIATVVPEQDTFVSNSSVVPAALDEPSTSTLSSILQSTMNTLIQIGNVTTELPKQNSAVNTTIYENISSTTTATTTVISTFNVTSIPTSIFQPFWNESDLWNTSTQVQNESSLPDVTALPETMTTSAAVLTLFPLVLITLFIISGNVLVVIAVFTKRSLRTPQNIYIVSLALTDMAVAILVLPFNMTTLVLQKWVFGDAICKLYLLMDVSLCCVSIFHLCAIGIDRYRAITDGINYVQQRNLRSVLTSILVLWVIALWIGSPTLLAVKDWEIRYDGISCEMPDSAGFNFHLAVGALFFPLILMTFIYIKIYYAIQERLRERARVTCMELTSDADTTDRLDNTTVSEDEGPKSKQNGRRKASAQISTFLVNKQKFSLSKERKAARTLGIIMAAFIFCWLPLGFLNVIGSLCPDGMKPHPIWFHTFTWLGYINSALNPIIYGVSNQEYQKAFRRILRLDN